MNKHKIDENLLQTYGQYDIEIESGNGCYVTDANGKTYLDMVAGIAVNALGYNHPILTHALTKQIQKVTQISNFYYSKPQAEACEKLVKMTDFDRVFFCSTGTEANEAVIKLARKYGKQTSPEKYTIVSMHNSFHGRTLGALSATGQKKYQAPFVPVVDGFKWITMNNSQELEATMNENVCAVMIEVIQGEGGVKPAQVEYLKAIRKLCDKYDALFIIDEVQTGVGRTGSLFAYSQFGIIPDAITTAKGLGAGIPVAAMLCKEKFAVLEKGDHGTTFGGNPLSTTALNVVLDELENGLQDHINEVGTYLEDKLEALKQSSPIIKEIRGKKLMQGIELTVSVAPIIEKCMEKGMLIIGAGEKVLRLLPPLIITKEEIDIAINILEEAIN
ncbi:MAG: acetylornithine aminotransferase [Epulopiscium sp. Nele67-Bin005]|nr:MAG: acetylornithine aminotransferase [Epulopiscium sp. Nele67-Bin005]